MQGLGFETHDAALLLFSGFVVVEGEFRHRGRICKD